MANESTESPPKWQKLLRQNSEKITALAEEVVLPKNQRTLPRKPKTPVPEVQALRQFAYDASYLPTTTINQMESNQMEPKYFPIFMIGISFIQVPLMYIANHNVLVRLFGYDPYRRNEVWRFITIMLVHTGFFHLWTNVVLQLVLGSLLEIVHNWKRIAIIYLSSILGGSLFITVLNPRAYAVGASAGVYGLLFSHLSTIILHFDQMDKKLCRLFGFLLFIIIDVIRFNLEPVDTNYAGHLGGAITGFLVSILVLKDCKKHQWQKIMQKICVVILALLCFIIILVNIFAPDYYLPTERNSNYESSYRDYILQLAKASPEDSAIRKLCKQDTNCKLLLNHFKFNVTTEGTTTN